MSETREYIATLVSITNEQVEKADGSGTYPAKVLTFEKSGGNGTYEKKVPIAFLKKNTALGEKIKEAEESMVGQKVLLCTQGYNITHIGKPIKKSFSGGGSGKSFGGGKSSSYEEGAKRGHAITNAVNIAIHQGLVNKDNILAQAQMILEVSAALESGGVMTTSSTEETSPPAKVTKTATKKAAGGDVQVDDFDF